MTTTSTTHDWPMLAFESDYKAVVAIMDDLQAGNTEEATEGLQELIESMSLSSQRELVSYLTLLMTHIIKWKSQCERRSTSWVRTIRHSRRQIQALQRAVPSITDLVIERFWDDCFADAVEDAVEEMDQRSSVESLDWQAVFDDEYLLPQSR